MMSVIAHGGKKLKRKRGEPKKWRRKEVSLEDQVAQTISARYGVTPMKLLQFQFRAVIRAGEHLLGKERKKGRKSRKRAARERVHVRPQILSVAPIFMWGGAYSDNDRKRRGEAARQEPMSL